MGNFANRFGNKQKSQQPQTAQPDFEFKQANRNENTQGHTNTAAQQQNSSSTRPFTHIGQLIAGKKTLSWVIRDYLPLETTCCIYGESGVGKSFLMLDMALHIATGNAWQGHKVKHGGVFYVAGEGTIGITARCHVWALENDVTLDSDTHFFCTDGALMPQTPTDSSRLINDVSAWIESTGIKPMLIVFDTLARCFQGEENSAADAGHYIRAVDTIKQHFKCCVVSVHHTGKDSSKGGRGSSAFKGAWDMEHSLTKQNDYILLQTTKSKESKPCKEKLFSLKTVDTGWLDDDNERVTSAVMVNVNSSQSFSVPSVKLSPRDRQVLAELQTAIERHGIPPTNTILTHFEGNLSSCPDKVVHSSKWRDLAHTVIDTTNKTKAFTDCKNKLRESNKVGFFDDYFWII